MEDLWILFFLLFALFAGLATWLFVHKSIRATSAKDYSGKVIAEVDLEKPLSNPQKEFDKATDKITAYNALTYAKGMAGAADVRVETLPQMTKAQDEAAIETSKAVAELTKKAYEKDMTLETAQKVKERDEFKKIDLRAEEDSLNLKITAAIRYRLIAHEDAVLIQAKWLEQIKLRRQILNSASSQEEKDEQLFPINRMIHKLEAQFESVWRQTLSDDNRTDLTPGQLAALTGGQPGGDTPGAEKQAPHLGDGDDA